MPETQAVDPTYWPPNVTGCRKIPHARGGNRTWAAGSTGRHFYCLAAEAGFYSDVVECLPVDPAAQVRLPPRACGIFLHPVTFFFFFFFFFLNGFKRFEDESISGGGKFIYRMSEEDWCVCCTMVPISYIL